MKPESDRLAHLQRIVYGTGTGASDSERAEAARELVALTSPGQPAETDGTGELSPVRPSTSMPGDASAGTSVDASAGTTAGSAADFTEGPAVERPSWVRRAIIAAAAALVIGVLAGWQLGAREAAADADRAASETAASATPFPGPRTQAEFLASQPVAAGSAAAAVFLRPATDADVPPATLVPDFGNGAIETRLLATRSDGSRVFAGRDDSEYCLILTMGGDLGGAATCTSDGRFPHDGLNVGWSSSGATPTFDVIWQADGTLIVSAAG
ncbi:hypothetical protein [Agromyces subbeticus]|uniref:hypothetical protein n=1 Tax=Agromyces subbeticus TaxID=293890 RepID=UPI0003B407B7|nr:hypothetical protein [Agromyces subbeticus]